MPESSFKKITSIDWSSKLNGLGEVVEGLDDIRQCISIILGTQKGSLPHRLDFGSDLWKYIDLPPSVAKPHIIREAAQAIADLMTFLVALPFSIGIYRELTSKE